MVFKSYQQDQRQSKYFVLLQNITFMHKNVVNILFPFESHIKIKSNTYKDAYLDKVASDSDYPINIDSSTDIDFYRSHQKSKRCTDYQ